MEDGRVLQRVGPVADRIAEALQAYPNISYRLARRASFLTAAKSQLIVAAIGLALALVIAALGPRLRAGSDDRHRLGNNG